MEEIAKNDYNLNISRYVSTAQKEPEVDLAATHAQLVKIEDDVFARPRLTITKHNQFLKELGLSQIGRASCRERV